MTTKHTPEPWEDVAGPEDYKALYRAAEIELARLRKVEAAARAVFVAPHYAKDAAWENLFDALED